MKNYFLFSSLLVIFALTSCSSDDDNQVQEATSLTIVGSADQINVGENINFSVESNLGDDKTAEATISVNDSPIEGNIFSTEETGNFFATATFEELTSDTFNFSVVSFREYDFNQAIVIYQGYINDEIDGISVDGFAYIVLAYSGQSILQNPTALEDSENQMGIVVITQEDENGNPYYPGESVETEQLVNTFLLKENGGEEQELTNELEEGNYSLTVNSLDLTSQMGGSANYQLELIFDEFNHYTGNFDGEFLFVDVTGGGGNPDERGFENFMQMNKESIIKIKNQLSK